MNENETEYSIEEYAITVEGNIEKGSHKNFLKLTARGSMEYSVSFAFMYNSNYSPSTSLSPQSPLMPSASSVAMS